MKLLKNRTVLGVLCIAVSLLICFAVTPLVNAGLSQKTTIVRFVKDVKAGEEIKKGMLQEVEVGGYNLPENVLRSITEAEGKYLTADVYAGDYIVAEKVADEPAAENKYLYNLNGEKQAISITISSFAEGLSGKLKSGDIVSVIAPDYLGSGEKLAGNIAHLYSMHLMGHDDMGCINTQLCGKTLAVLGNMLGKIAAIFVDIEFAIVALAHSTLAGCRESHDTSGYLIFFDHNIYSYSKSSRSSTSSISSSSIYSTTSSPSAASSCWKRDISLSR